MASEDEANAATAAAAEDALEGKKEPRRKGKHNKPKPWDEDPNIDRWKVDKFNPSWNEGCMPKVTSFSTLFPQYREKYLQEAWLIMKGALEEFGVSCELNLVKGAMTVSTTRKTTDPFIIFKAIKILNDEMGYDIIKIGSLERNKERFVKRRERLLGPNLSTLKAIEILTGCYILVQGNTVSAMGSFKRKGLKQVRRIAEDCITNVKYPVYHIKELLIKRELAKIPALATESWDRFLPKFKKNNVKQKKTNQTKKKKPYTPFPPPQQPSKTDLELESGEYFMSDKNKLAKTWQEKLEKQAGKSEENKRKRKASFVPPKENSAGPSETDKATNDNNDMIADLAKSLKKKAKDFRKNKAQENVRVESYLASTEDLPKKEAQVNQ